MVDIKFTKEQFEALLKMAYLGNWMLNAHRVDDAVDECNEVEEYLFSKTPLFGLEHFSDSDLPGFPNSDFESALRDEYLEEYNDETFWDGLAERFAYRQVGRLFTEEELEKMDQMERFLMITNIEDEFRNEFSKNGIDNLVFKTELAERD